MDNSEETLNTLKVKNNLGEKKNPALINTESKYRLDEDRISFICPICDIKIYVPAKYRKHDDLKCFNCHHTFKNPIFHPDDHTIYKKVKTQRNESGFWREYYRKYPNFKYALFVGFVVLLIYIIGLFSSTDPDYEKFIETRANMYMLKKKGLVTDKDIKQYEDAFYESRRKKK